MVFYNIATPQILLPAFLAVVRPRKFFLETQDGAALMTLSDDEVKKAFYKKLRALPMFSLKTGLSLLLNPLFRLAALGFGFFLYSKKGGKKVEFTPQGPRLTGMNEKGK